MAVAVHGGERSRSVSTPRRLRRRVRPGLVLKYGFIAIAVAFTLFPIYWIAVMSIKPATDYIASPPVWFPSDPTTAHWSILGQLRGWQGLKNSIIVAVATTAVSVAIGTMAAYSIARFRTGGKHLAFWILSQRIMPPIAVIIPVFLLYTQLRDNTSVNLLDTHVGLVILYTVFTLPFTVWMMYTYFRQLPVEMEEASLVDGCTRWQSLWKVAFPLAAPGLVSAAVFAFIFSWTEFLFAVVLTSSKAVTLPVVISGFLGVQASLLGELGALVVLSMIPAFTLGLLVQRHLVRGLTFGAVQG
ncbi:MAG: carbohydrate ABC transporter permease [Gaiellales bacterium]